MKYLNALQDKILRLFWGEILERKEHILPLVERPAFLYHYTSRDSFVSILDSIIDAQKKDPVNRDNCGFAFTDYRFLNDSKEISLGLCLAEKWLREWPGDLEVFVARIIKALKDKVRARRFVPHILSLTTNSDATVNWAAYTNRTQGGYAIE